MKKIKNSTYQNSKLLKKHNKKSGSELQSVLTIGLFLVAIIFLNRNVIIYVNAAIAENPRSLLNPIKYYSKYINCGKKPIVTHDFLGRTYILPNDNRYQIGLFDSEYFCTENQAKAAGYEKLPVERNDINNY